MHAPLVYMHVFLRHAGIVKQEGGKATCVRKRNGTVRAAAALAVSGPPADAQESGRLTGGFAGRTDSEMLWSPPVETSPRSGFLAGAFVDVPTPVSWLRMRAEGGLAQRGGFVSNDTRGNAVDGEVRGDYLGVHIEAKAGLSLGPVHAFAVAGPVIDYLLRNREDPVLAQVFVEERGTVPGGGGGSGARPARDASVGDRSGDALGKRADRSVLGIGPAGSEPVAGMGAAAVAGGRGLTCNHLVAY